MEPTGRAITSGRYIGSILPSVCRSPSLVTIEMCNLSWLLITEQRAFSIGASPKRTRIAYRLKVILADLIRYLAGLTN